MTNEARFAPAYAKLRADRSIQFDLPVYEPPRPPDWLEPLVALLRWAAPAFPYLFWGVIGLVALAAIWAIVSRLDGFAWLRWRRSTKPKSAPEWVPDAATARASLVAAEALAAEGRYAEAARLLLRRSVDDIGTRLPQFLKPSLTARDIAAATALPDAARPAFASIAQVVEVSAFGAQHVTAEAWDQCRTAYARFALPQSWARA